MVDVSGGVIQITTASYQRSVESRGQKNVESPEKSAGNKVALPDDRVEISREAISRQEAAQVARDTREILERNTVSLGFDPDKFSESRKTTQ